MTVKSALQTLRLKIGKALLDKRKALPKTADPARLRKILFLRQDGKIGDYMVSSFVFRELKKQQPQLEIHVLCTKNNAELFRRNPYIDRLHFVKKRSIWDRIKCGRKLKSFCFDLVIDPTVFLRNRDLLLLRLIGARNYLGYLKRDYVLFNYQLDDPNRHFSEVYAEALKQIGFVDIDRRYDIPCDPPIEREVQQFLARHRIASGFIALNFYGNGNNRRFSPEHIRKFLAYFAAIPNTQYVVLTTPQDVAELSRLCEPYANIVVNPQANSIYHSIAVIRQAEWLISPDTATVHIAAGLNKKLIAFYSQGAQNFANWHPNNANTTHILRYPHRVDDIQPEQIKPEWLF